MDDVISWIHRCSKSYYKFSENRNYQIRLHLKFYMQIYNPDMTHFQKIASLVKKNSASQVRFFCTKWSSDSSFTDLGWNGMSPVRLTSISE